MLVKEFQKFTCQVMNWNLLKVNVSEIQVKQISVNQGVVVTYPSTCRTIIFYWKG